MYTLGTNEYRVSVAGIPAIALVTSHTVQKPMGQRADNPDDCYGYSEMEFELKDRNGYPRKGQAQWLYDKAEATDLWGDIEAQIEEEMEGEY